MAISIVLAVHQALARVGLSAVLATEPEITLVGEANNAKELRALALDLQPKIVLMELCLPGPPVDETIRQLKSLNGEIKIILLATLVTEIDSPSLIRAEINGLILKDEPIESFIDVIKTVMQRGTWFSRSDQKKTENLRNSETALTCREIEVLKLVADGKKNEQIAEELGVAERTVRTHIESIITKMQVNNRTEAATKAIRLGWIK